MEKLIAFIVENKELLILGVACLLDLILFLVGVFRKRDRSVLDQVIYSLPVFITKSEELYGSGHGEDKLKYCLSLALDHYFVLSGVRLSETSVFAKVLIHQIESILETPTKKGK